MPELEQPIACTLDGKLIYAFLEDSNTPICGYWINGQGECTSTEIGLQGRCSEHSMPLQTISRLKREGTLRDRITQRAKNPALLDMSDRIGAVDEHYEQLLDKMGDGLDTVTLAQLNKMADKLEVAMTYGDYDKQNNISKTLIYVIRKGRNENSLWLDIINNGKAKGQFVDVEIKRYEAQKNTISESDVRERFEVAFECFYKVIESLDITEQEKLDAGALLSHHLSVKGKNRLPAPP